MCGMHTVCDSIAVTGFFDIILLEVRKHLQKITSDLQVN